MMIFNQFAEMGNPLWHYNVTGYALADLFEAIKKPGQNFAGACFTSGSAGTMSAGDLLKERYPHLKLAVGEALQCPTILDNGFGGHRIEGIGDKHIPWIHNVKNTDMAIAIDDEDSQRLLRLFNTPEGKQYMKDELGMSAEEIEKMSWLGISGIANVLCCIKMAKYYELTENDVVATVLTDSAVMYGSRIEELNAGADLHRAQACPQPEVLHLGGAAGYGRGGPERPVVRHQEHLGCRSRSGQGAGSADLRVQRGHRPAEGSVSTNHPTRRRRGGTSVPPLRFYSSWDRMISSASCIPAIRSALAS